MSEFGTWHSTRNKNQVSKLLNPRKEILRTSTRASAREAMAKEMSHCIDPGYTGASGRALGTVGEACSSNDFTTVFMQSGQMPWLNRVSEWQLM
jgi:hypothetical protein